MSKRQKFLSELKDAVSTASRTRLCTRPASSSFSPQGAAVHIADPESPCPAFDDDQYDEFIKHISPSIKHDVGAKIAPFCTVSKQSADFSDGDGVGKENVFFDINRYPGLNDKAFNANNDTSVALTSNTMARLAPVEDTCNRYGKPLQSLEQNLFGAEKSGCSQGFEFKYASRSDCDESSLHTIPAASRVPTPKTNHHNENPSQSVKRNLFGKETVIFNLERGCSGGNQSGILASSLPTILDSWTDSFVPRATKSSLSNRKPVQTIKQHLLGEEKENYFQDPGLKDRTERNDVRISLSANPPQTSKVPQLPIANEINPRNGQPLLLTKKKEYLGKTASCNENSEDSDASESSIIESSLPTSPAETSRVPALPSATEVILSDGNSSTFDIGFDDVIMSPMNYTVDISTGDIMLDLSSGHENQHAQPEELGLEPVIEETTVLEQLDTEAPKRKRQFTPPEKLTRKRVRAPQTWQKNVNKEQFSKGIEYVNQKGIVKKARKLQPGCDLSCRSKCITKVLEPTREEIFKNFWSIPSHVEKWGFISRLIKTLPVLRSSLATPKKKHSRKYFLRVQGSDIKVCKTMFLATLDICDSWVETALDKVEEGGTISPDKRGSHLNRPGPTPKSDAEKQTIRDHIATLQRMPSHYSRANTNREYLSEEFKSVADMHEIYTGWMSEQHPTKSLATMRQYRDVFNYEYNLDFFIPMKDLCDVCVTYQNTPADQRQPAMESAYLEHTRTKDLLYLMKKADMDRAKLKTSTTLCVVDMDYQKSLITPKCFTSVFYYRRKLSVNNFTMVDVGRSEDCCYVYDETTAKKGSKEVSSFINHFITRKAGNGVKEFIFYCDNCSGQNKNRNIVAFLSYISAKLNIKVTVKYLEKGHTYNSADTVHSLIERKSRPHQVYTPAQWYEIIANSKRSKAHPMVVEKVHQDMIFDWNDLADKLNLDKNVHGQAIPWTKVREFRFSGETPHEFQYKMRYEDEPTTVSTKTVGRPVNFITYELKKLYSGPLPISQAKLKDLLYYCDHNYIPVIYQAFYRALMASEDVPDNVIAAPEVDIPLGRARTRRPAVQKKRLQRNTAAPVPSGRSARKKRMQAAKKQKTNEENQEASSEEDSECDNPAKL